MAKLLIPCDGSTDCLAAVRHVIGEVRRGQGHRIHLVNVQPPLGGRIVRHVDRQTLRDVYRERADEAFATSLELLEAAGLDVERHREVGDKVDCITRLAVALGCDRIVMGTQRKSGLVRVVTHSLTSRMIDASPVPVEVITADPAPALQRVGIPAGLGAGLTLLWLH